MRASDFFLGSLLSLGLLVTPGCGDKDDSGADGTATGTTDGGVTGDGGTTAGGTDADSDGVTVEDGDCNDSDPSIFPGQDEECDGIDQNCNDLVDEGYGDSDGDTIADCVDTEECDGVDNDGDGDIDEGFDEDGDGVGDCLADEVCDGVDNDGDGDIDEGHDVDGDGYTWCGSDDVAADCDDGDAAIHPDADEVAGDLEDNDCDGMVDEDEWGAGDIYVTEIMNNPYDASDPDGEWFEVYNASGRELILNGMVITSSVDDDWHKIDSDELIWITPGEHLVLGINSTTYTNGNVEVAYEYVDVSLQNETDDLILMVGDVVVDEVSWDDGATMPDPQGATMNLDPSAYGAILNDSGNSWCESSFEWAADTDYGSPGAENEFCWPVAAAGYDADESSLFTCDELYLVGSDSYDPDGADITYEWELVSAPADSEMTSSDIIDTDDADPNIVPDEPGTYQFALTVYNGTVYSEPIYVTVEIAERPYNDDPVAIAGDDRTYAADKACTPISYGAYYSCSACDEAEFEMDATESYDPDDDEITDYAWEITGGSGSGSIDDETSTTPTVTMAGPTTTYGDTTAETLELTLTITDCMGATGDDEVVLTYECTGT